MTVKHIQNRISLILIFFFIIPYWQINKNGTLLTFTIKKRIIYNFPNQHGNPPRIKEKYNDGKDYTDADAMKTAWKEYVENDEKEEMLDLFFEQSGPALDWLSLDHNIEFDYLVQIFVLRVQ